MASEAKAALFDQFAVVGKALANGRRAELVDVLAQGERAVEALAEQLGHSLANTSQHLQVLSRAGLVTSRRDGNRVLYRLADEQVESLWEALRVVAAANVAGVRQAADEYLGDRDDIAQVRRDELLARLGGGVVVWDVRPPSEYEAGHVPGAVSVPPEDVRRRVDDVPEDVEVVAYCRGRYCVYADDAVRALAAAGRRAARLDEGFPEWRRAGLPVAVGAEAGRP